MSDPGYPSELILDLLNELTDLANDAEEYHPTPAELASSIRMLRDEAAGSLRSGLGDVWAVTEQAQLAGMAHGVDAYNEAMGWDTSSPEPCGHHCVGAYPPCHCMNDEQEE